jgi:FkbM family methyltransferase
MVGYALDRLSRRVWARQESRRDWRVEFDDVSLMFRPGNGELALYYEINVERMYELHPAFVPREGWSVVDVGANIGIFSLRAARLVGRSGRVVSVEPHPDTYARLVVNLEANGARNVRPIRAAVGSRDGVAQLIQGAGSTTARLSEGSEATPGALSVKVATLDRLVREMALPRLDLLKLDIEGGEVAALEGAQDALSRCGRLVLELHDTRAAVQELLEARGFDLVCERAPSLAYYVNRALVGARSGECTESEAGCRSGL